ncbi:MAG: DnaA N-terminal domain-containing protein [Alphaproteobacteria bacterium]
MTTIEYIISLKNGLAMKSSIKELSFLNQVRFLVKEDNTTFHQAKINNQRSSFSRFSELFTSKSYIPIAGCVFEHILDTSDLSSLEKLFYITADSLSLINSNSGKQRSVALPSQKWASRLNCSKSLVFKLQQSLSEKGYFVLVKDKNKYGQNKRNLIIPTLPQEVFDRLYALPDRIYQQHLPYDPSIKKEEYKRAYLDKTKLFIKLNYQLLSIITTSCDLTPLQKTIWLDFYVKCYKNHMSSNQENAEFSLKISYLELTNKYGCNRSFLSKAIKGLETLGFITKNQFYTRKEKSDQERQDKSLWQLTLCLPNIYEQELRNSSDRSKSANSLVITASGSLANTVELEDNGFNKDDVTTSKADTNYDKTPCSTLGLQDFVPPVTLTVSNSVYILNKNLKTNIKNSDGNCEGKKSKCLKRSIFFKNDFKKEKTKQEKVEQEKNQEAGSCTKSQTLTVISEIKCAKSKELKPSKAVKTLLAWYPLSQEQVKELNCRSRREFSLNFANELLLKLNAKYPNRTFKFKNQLMSYMAKAFLHEKHQGPMVNHQSFKFAINHNVNKEGLVEQNDGVKRILITTQPTPKRSDLLATINQTAEPEFWQQIKRSLLMNNDVNTYISWFSKLSFAKFEQGILELKAPNRFIASYMEQHFAGKIKTAAIGFLKELKKVKIDMNPDNFAGYSLRSGFITTAAKNSVPDRTIMKHSSHKSIQMLQVYTRDNSLIEDNATSMVGL